MEACEQDWAVQMTSTWPGVIGLIALCGLLGFIIWRLNR